MVTISIPTATIKDALVEGVRELISELGETVIYHFNDGTPDESFRAVRKKLPMEEVVGDFHQGDCRFTIDATTLSKAPEKYDTIETLDGHVYALVDYLSVDIGVDDTVLVYKPVGRV